MTSYWFKNNIEVFICLLVGEVSREEVVGEDTVEISDSDEDDGEEEEEEEEEDVSQFNTLFKLMSSEKTREGPAPTRDEQEDEEQLDEGRLRVRNMEDLEVLEEVSDPRPGTSAAQSMPQPSASDPPAKKSKREISLDEVLTKGAKTIKVALTPTVVEDEVSDGIHRIYNKLESK